MNIWYYLFLFAGVYIEQIDTNRARKTYIWGIWWSTESQCVIHILIFTNHRLSSIMGELYIVNMIIFICITSYTLGISICFNTECEYIITGISWHSVTCAVKIIQSWGTEYLKIIAYITSLTAAILPFVFIIESCVRITVILKLNFQNPISFSSLYWSVQEIKDDYF